MNSLEIVDSHIKSIVDYLDNPQVKEDIDCLNIMCVGVSYKELQQIKQDLEILKLIIKWKSNIYLRYDFEYLNNEESIIMQSELKLIENYLAHHFGYIPKCFNKVGDSNE